LNKILFAVKKTFGRSEEHGLCLKMLSKDDCKESG